MRWAGLDVKSAHISHSIRGFEGSSISSIRRGSGVSLICMNLATSWIETLLLSWSERRRLLAADRVYGRHLPIKPKRIPAAERPAREHQTNVENRA